MKLSSRSLIPALAFAFALVAFSSLSAGANAVSSPRQAHFMGLFGKTLPLSNQNQPNVTYHGGPVMAGTSQTYAIFWEPAGSKVSKNYNSLLLRYLQDVGGSKLYHNNVQYTDSHGGFPSGSNLGASWLDTSTPYPSQNLSDLQVQQEVTHAMRVNGWQPFLQHLFLVFTALKETDFVNTAYHNNFNGDTIYAIVPDIFARLHIFPGHGPNHDVAADSSILVTSHEQMEAATDATPFNNLAWIDRNGNEIGDKCETYFGHINPDGGNVHWNGHSYIVQGEWDNAKHNCALVGP